MMNILIASSSPQTTAALHALLASDPDLNVVGMAQTSQQAIDMALDLQPDLVAFDACLPISQGVKSVAQIVAQTLSMVTIIAPPACQNMDRAARYLAAGAVDIAEFPPALANTIPSETSPEMLREIGRDLLAKLKAAIDHSTIQQHIATNPADKVILVVEDSSIDLWVIQNTLAKEGYRVLTAATGQQALDLVRETEPNLIILDYLLPDMDGIQVLREIRRLAPDALVIISTAHGSERVAAAALHEQANYYMIKPIIPWQLLKLVDSSLKQQETTEALSRLMRLHLNVLDQLPVGVFVLDKDQHVQAWNQAMEAITKQPAERVMGKKVAQACPFIKELESREAFAKLVNGTPQIIDELDMVDHEGNKQIISVQLCRLPTNDEIFGVIQDVTARVQLREKLLQAERAATISRMVVTTSHEINNPLTVVLSNVMFLEEDLAPLPAVAKRDLELIKEGIAQIQKVIERMQKLVEPTATWYMPGVEMYDLPQDDTTAGEEQKEP